MKLRCLICHAPRELTTEENVQIGEWIELKNLQAVDYLERVSLEDGYTCQNEKKHRYEFEEGFDKEVHDLAKDLSGNITEKEANTKRITEIEEQIKKLEEELDEKNNSNMELDESAKEMGYKLKEITGNKKYQMWI